MGRETWKNTERKIASLLNGQRVPVTGRARGDVPDISHPTLSIEVKHRKLLPEWIKDAMRQAVASIREKQCPVVILHELGQRHDNDWVLLRMQDFKKLLTKTSKG